MTSTSLRARLGAGLIARALAGAAAAQTSQPVQVAASVGASSLATTRRTVLKLQSITEAALDVPYAASDAVAAEPS